MVIELRKNVKAAILHVRHALEEITAVVYFVQKDSFFNVDFALPNVMKELLEKMVFAHIVRKMVVEIASLITLAGVIHVWITTSVINLIVY